MKFKIDIYMSGSNRYFHGFTRFIKGAEIKMQKKNYEFQIINSDKVSIEDYTHSRGIRSEHFVFVMGVTSIQEREIIHEFKKKEIPFIIINMDSQNINNVNVINMDHKAAAFDLTQYLIHTGRNKIAFLGLNSFSIPDMKKLEGYKKALSENNISFRESSVFGYGERKISEAISEFMDKRINFDAVICTTDSIAVLLMIPERFNSLKIPEELAVVGFDNLSIGTLTCSPLTTVSCDFVHVGELAITAMETLKNDRNISSINLVPKHKIIIRESCGNKLLPNPEPALERNDCFFYSHKSPIVSQIPFCIDRSRNPTGAEETFFDHDLNTIELLESFLSRISSVRAKILADIMAGFIYREIGERVFLSLVSVKSNVGIMKKMLHAKNAKEIKNMMNTYLDPEKIKTWDWIKEENS